MRYERIPCAIIRGGTSKGLFFHDRDLPRDPVERGETILSAFGSPDRYQIDGLGGAATATSKVAILSPSRRPDADVDYTFAQVGIDSPTINYSVNCGNLAAGAAIFAVDEGLVLPEEPWTTVSIHNTNSGFLCLARVETERGRAASTGGFRIDGVPGTGSPIELTFPDVAGAVTGTLLPSGNVVDRIPGAPGRTVEVSLVDAGNLYALVAAADLGLRGDEPPEELGRDDALRDLVRRIFDGCSELVRQRTRTSGVHRVQKLALVSAGGSHGDAPCDLTCRIFSDDGSVHRSFAVTGAISVAFAAVVEGSVVHRLRQEGAGSEIRIGHPQGALPVEVACDLRDGVRRPVAARIWRTARRLMEGFVWARCGRGDRLMDVPRPPAALFSAGEVR